MHFAHPEHVAGTPSATHVDGGTPASCWGGGGAEASVVGGEVGAGGGLGEGAGAGSEAASSAGRAASTARGGSVERVPASCEDPGSGTSLAAASRPSVLVSLPAEIDGAEEPASLLPTAHARR